LKIKLQNNLNKKGKFNISFIKSDRERSTPIDSNRGDATQKFKTLSRVQAIKRQAAIELNKYRRSNSNTSSKNEWENTPLQKHFKMASSNSSRQDNFSNEIQKRNLTPLDSNKHNLTMKPSPDVLPMMQQKTLNQTLACLKRQQSASSQIVQSKKRVGVASKQTNISLFKSKETQNVSPYILLRESTATKVGLLLIIQITKHRKTRNKFRTATKNSKLSKKSELTSSTSIILMSDHLL